MTAFCLTVRVSVGIKVHVIRLQVLPRPTDLVVGIRMVGGVSVPERGRRRGGWGMEGGMLLCDITFIITGLKDKNKINDLYLIKGLICILNQKSEIKM